MQPQLEPSADHHGYTEGQLNAPPTPHSAEKEEFVHGGVEEYDEGHEKKSMLNKVKAKAKKFKDTFKMHTPGPEGHDDHEHGDHHDYQEEKEDDDEEMEQDPEVHAAGAEGRHARPGMTTPPVDPSYATTPHPVITPQKSTSAETAGPKGVLEERAVSEEDPHGPGARDDKSENYQTKVADPTGRGGVETGGGLESSLDKLNIHDDSKSPDVVQARPQQGGGSYYYTEKLSSAAFAVADKAAQAKNAVVSKLGYGTPAATSHEQNTNPTVGGGGGQHTSTGADMTDGSRGQETASNAATGSVGEYGKKLVEVPYNKVRSTMQGPKEAEVVDTEMVDDSMQQGSGNKGRGQSAKGYFLEKLSPGEEDRVLSQVIAEALRSTERKGKEKEDMRRRVTGTEEVRGPDGDGEGTVAQEDDGGGLGGGTDGAGRTVVGRLKGAVTDWFGKGTGETPPSQEVHEASQK